MLESSSFFRDKTLLITGGTGSLGHELVRILSEEDYPLRKLIVFSRDEYKQWMMRMKYPNVRFYLGDVRDERRVSLAFHGVDFVIHAAALKQVPLLEENPFEAVQTNILGARNVIEAALEREVARVVAISTDKACAPLNLYGATKLVAEKLFLDASSYKGTWSTLFSVVRYGNVMDSRGGVLSLWKKQKLQGLPLTVTHRDMTRFWITLNQGAHLVLRCLQESSGRELWVPKLPTFSVADLACAFTNHRLPLLAITGVRPGEKISEVLISKEESRNVMLKSSIFILSPDNPSASQSWEYSSGGFQGHLSVKELKEKLSCLQLS